MMITFFLMLLVPVWSSTITLTITELTTIGQKIGFKPFNCFVCLSWWIGIIFGAIVYRSSFDWEFISIPIIIGSGGMSSLYAYFIKKQIWKI